MRAATLVLALSCFAANGDEAELAAARNLLAEKLGATSEDAQVVTATPATWRGPGVGCASVREGDEVVAGTRIVLRVPPNTYVVHARGNEAMVCALNPPEQAQAVAQPETPRERKLVAAARRDLAGRLGSDRGITLVDVAQVTWRDSSLGCPRPNLAYTQVLTPGVRIRFRIGPRVYQYHAGSGGEPFLCERPEAVEPLAER